MHFLFAHTGRFYQTRPNSRSRSRYTYAPTCKSLSGSDKRTIDKSLSRGQLALYAYVAQSSCGRDLPRVDTSTSGGRS